MARMHMDCILRVHAPLSESLNHLDGSQLQKLVQYLAEKTPSLIPSLQGLVSELQDPKSEINAIDGAPGELVVNNSHSKLYVKVMSMSCERHMNIV